MLAFPKNSFNPLQSSIQANSKFQLHDRDYSSAFVPDD